MIAPGMAVCPTFSHAAFAFLIHEFAFHLQVTVLFCPTYHVQFHHTNPCHPQLFFTAYRDLSHVSLSRVVGRVDGTVEGIIIVVAVIVFFLFFSATFTISLAAPGIMISLPLLSDEASLRLFTLTISSGSTP